MNIPMLSDDLLFVTHAASKHEQIHSLLHKQHIINGVRVLPELSLWSNRLLV